jgi:hypothetical protein
MVRFMQLLYLLIMRDDMSFHNEDEDGDQDIMSLYTQFFDNVGTYYQDP